VAAWLDDCKVAALVYSMSLFFVFILIKLYFLLLYITLHIATKINQ